MRRFALFIPLLALLLVPASASALTVSKAELKDGQLRIEGSGAAPAGSNVVAKSSTSAASARVQADGQFRIEASNFSAPDCTVIVSDTGNTPIAQPTLSGCTPTPAPPVTSPQPPSGSCVINPGDPVTFTVGDLQSLFFTTTGCAGPVQWSLVAGRIPPGMDAPVFQGQTSGMVSGTPTTEGTYTFTVQVTDSTGATDQETFTIVVVAPRPLTITTPATLPQATVGRSYQVDLQADGGLPGYAWAFESGTLPPGMLVSTGPVPAIAGTPTSAGTFTFSVRVTDSRGTTSDRTFTLTVA